MDVNTTFLVQALNLNSRSGDVQKFVNLGVFIITKEDKNTGRRLFDAEKSISNFISYVNNLQDTPEDLDTKEQQAKIANLALELRIKKIKLDCLNSKITTTDQALKQFSNEITAAKKSFEGLGTRLATSLVDEHNKITIKLKIDAIVRATLENLAAGKDKPLTTPYIQKILNSLNKEQEVDTPSDLAANTINPNTSKTSKTNKRGGDAQVGAGTNTRANTGSGKALNNRSTATTPPCGHPSRGGELGGRPGGGGNAGSRTRGANE